LNWSPVFLPLGAYNRGMDCKALLPVEIASALERGAMVVTGNQRAARTLRREFDRRQSGLGLNSWQPPAVLAWDTWTAELWHQLLLDGNASLVLLNRTQEHAVWRAVLEADAELASLRSVDSLAEMAADAWKLLCRYDGPGRLRRAATSADTRAFQRWAQMFERTCRSEGLLTLAQLEGTLREAVDAGNLKLGTGGLVLVGFDAMTPAQTGLVETLREAGAVIEDLWLNVQRESRTLVATTNEAEELSVAARWTRTFLEERPESRVAVIVPGLETQRAEIDRIFREVLAPELEDIQAQGAAAPYEFSLGRPLAQVPLAAVALELLRWTAEPLPLEQVSGLLLSPYFSGARNERSARAEFDAFELRRARMLRPEISLDWLSKTVDRSKRRTRLGRLAETLHAMRRVVATRLSSADRRSHAEWAERMQELLVAAGWGVSEAEDSIEFQTRRSWESALDELATLDFDGQRVGFEEALEGLVRIAGQTIFAPESREAPVQVMGPLEAAGSSFDAVWFLRGGDLSWPLATGANPLLPWQMQRELAMPGTDVAQDSEAARRMTERIAESAAIVVFSYAKESAEGKQRASTALAGLALDEAEPTEMAGPTTERRVLEIEELWDTERVRALPDRVIRGGARILELQAACGFRAFAEQRLWSTEVETAELGMDAMESGTLVHRVLEYFWDDVKSQSALRAMTTAERSELLEACIARALARAEELSENVWDAAYLGMQRERLRRLLSAWLKLELERSPFEVKLSEKEFEDVRVGPLRLSIRMDRVDIVEGGEVVIDYKTGLTSPSDWLTDRPSAPQLPLYAILSDPDQLQGVAVGQVRVGEDMELKGYATSDGVLPKRVRMKVPSLAAQVDDWRRVLVQLAEDFAAGDARVAPNKYPTTCDRCGQRILCRLDVSLLDDDEEEADPGTEGSLG
jgi:ATP-dependent helicase/nuclease subunit B